MEVFSRDLGDGVKAAHGPSGFVVRQRFRSLEVIGDLSLTEMKKEEVHLFWVTLGSSWKIAFRQGWRGG